MHIIQNLAIFWGIYSFIGSIWQIYEIFKYGKPMPNRADTICTLVAAAIATAALHV